MELLAQTSHPHSWVFGDIMAGSPFGLPTYWFFLHPPYSVFPFNQLASSELSVGIWGTLVKKFIYAILLACSR
ncbi:hypothetical protein AKJ65_05105 [candidate division MSBL1 archaeon SCGC-AAA259E19]|uniref:Uncharacterized protein n=1 Tax=candidate division MSBL1 archaeon SCGC-AAA259E19 TaxID=1698264 RepID=A0A133UJ78_9EURY|nr:hypothetical protein AKJ65_05105 [candidate division MSBL1 archaeon SCGC-AAA259E19]